MDKRHKALHYFTLLILAVHFELLKASTNPDLNPLLDFKASSDKANQLTTWNSTSDLCSWTGVSCLQNRVSHLVLENLQLSGPLQQLTSLTRLRVLSLKFNHFTGPVPDLSNLTSLKLLFISHNNFYGQFPDSLSSLFRLYRLDLSYNNFSGQIPLTVNRLTHLLTLKLETNQFSGPITGLDLPNLQDFNVSGNHLSGQIPKSLSSFPNSAFTQNTALCGFPMQACKAIVADPTKPGSNGAVASPVNPGSNPASIVSSTPSAIPTNTGPRNTNKAGSPEKSSSSKISSVAVIAIVLGDFLVLAVISLLLYCYFWRNYVNNKTTSKLLESEKIVYSSSPYLTAQQGGCERGSMVFFEGAKRFELEDLLRASAEMLGKGGFGTAYKALLDDGSVVAVKRLKDASIGGKREFEQHMEVLGRLRHPNLVGLKAYYFAREEKLLVSDYMPNGSLFWLLHGNRGPGRTPLDWATRLKVASGAARGLAFIHNTCKSLKLTHGNIKSTNILLDKTGNARVSDFGLSIFAPSSTVPRSNGYRAPELSSSDGRKQSQKSDVYSFGVLLLELLTGKCPSVIDGGGGSSGAAGIGYGSAVDLPRWVQSVVREEWTAEVFDLELMRYKNIEEEMVGLLQVAMACTSASPDQRPTIGQVVKMIEELRGVEVSPSHENFDSVSDSPCLSEETLGGASQ